MRVFNNLLESDDPCSTYNLRAFNLGVSEVNLILIYFIVRHYNPELSLTKFAFSALNIATFPVPYFFSFLYYTDSISTPFLLLMHFMFLRGRYGYSAWAGGYSVSTRQTNIVWVLYHGINSILEVLTRTFGEKIFLYPLEYRKYLMGSSQPAKVKKRKRSKSSTKRPKPVKPVKPPFHLPSIPQRRACGDDFGDRGCNYVLVGVSFLVFVIYNGSIVVGDKQAHQATLNFPQIGYFELNFGIFTSPFLLCENEERFEENGILSLQHSLFHWDFDCADLLQQPCSSLHLGR
ncbi:unnamed protein product [Orchesella dallaii]|uniref:Dol-P-Glc:Glc(2)Man(9)GlcNAc(2)-PP-Dol alpha-1,2-glucosyltransferase n=1 Tax=Orchesella dallaii TaxID=48710 RepID=A0ABP1RNY0_9HEXA